MLSAFLMVLTAPHRRRCRGAGRCCGRGYCPHRWLWCGRPAARGVHLNHPRMWKWWTAREIVKRNLATVEEVLKTLPGVDGSRRFGDRLRISIRGSGKSGVLVLVNGRHPEQQSERESRSQTTFPWISSSPSPSSNRGSVWLGPGGSEGAIAIVTRNPGLRSGKNDRRRPHLKMGGGSFGYAEASLSRQLPWPEVALC